MPVPRLRARLDPARGHQIIHVRNPSLAPVQAYQPEALYFVRSDKRPHVFYTVGQVDNRCACGQHIAGLWHCSCPDHINRVHDCKHIDRVVSGEIRPATVKATPKPASVRSSFDIDSLYGDAGEGIRRSLAVQKVHSSALAAVAS